MAREAAVMAPEAMAREVGAAKAREEGVAKARGWGAAAAAARAALRRREFVLPCRQKGSCGPCPCSKRHRT